MSKLKYILLLIVALLLVSLLTFGNMGKDSKAMNTSEKELLTESAEAPRQLYYSSKKYADMKKIASSGMLEMYLDERRLAVCILDTISGKLWRTLPNKDTTENSCNLSVDILFKGRVYTLNSQSDGVALSLGTYEVADNTLTIAYNLKRSTEKGREIDITIPLDFTLTDGTLEVSLDCKKITDNSSADITIKSVSILPYFGADKSGKDGDFILLPSASGIILDTSEATDNFTEIALPVYGEDSAKNEDATSYVPIPAFGMKSGKNAFICLIEKGDETATIKSQKALNDGTANRVSAEFEITPTLITEDTIYYSKESYDGTVSLSYRFLSGNNADYITMAGACRELLIRNGTLTDSSKDSTSYPFNLTLLSDTAEKGQTTTHQEAQELITAMLTKGIGNIHIILESDSNKTIASLSDFAKKENLSLSLSRNLCSYSKNASLTLSGDKSTVGIKDISDNAEAIITTMRKYNIGVSIKDVGSILPSDYSKKAVKRSEVLRTVSDIATTLSSQGNLTVSKGNIYTVKYADNIINIPLSSPLEDSTFCKSVPFLQAVLHGICNYSFTPINLSSDQTTAILKSIEYGAVPHYEWYFTEAEESDVYHYMNSLSEARLVYENMKNMFSDLMDQRITSHEEIRDNVFCSVYSGGSEIYVNYNNKAVTVNGITIDPMGFIRVN